MRYRCPICMFPRLPYPPRDYHICPCCGTEFGNDDVDFSYQQLREMWVAGGANWFFGRAPEHWNPWVQLLRAGLTAYVPQFVADLRVQANAIVEPAGIRNFTQTFVVRAAA
jgi:hypothetical protein